MAFLDDIVPAPAVLRDPAAYMCERSHGDQWNWSLVAGMHSAYCPVCDRTRL